FAYDPGGRVVLEIAPADIDGDGARERWEERYDGFGRLVARIDPLGGTRIFERDAAGRIVSDAFVAPAGGSGLALLERTLLEHDARGRLARRSRLLFGNGDIAREVVETFAYDPEGRLVKETGPGGRTRELLRDGAGRVVEERFDSGLRIARELDGRGNVIVERRLDLVASIVDPSR